MYDVAVVGSGGFLGDAAVRELTRRGHRVSLHPRHDPLVVDGRWSERARGVHTVVWAAGSVTPAVAAERPELAREELAVLEEAVEASAALDVPPRIVLMSSGGAVYGHPGLPPYREDHEPHPANAYGEFKLAQERLVRRAGAPATALRIANAYGPGQQGGGKQGVLAIWMDAVLAGEPIRVYGDPDAERDYVYVDDVADLVATVVERPDAPAVVNAGSGRPTHLADLADLVRYTVAPLEPAIERHAARGHDAPSTWLDVSLARHALGWTPRMSLADGLRRMWEARR